MLGSILRDLDRPVGRVRPPVAGDVVICTRPVDPAESIIKRVVALEVGRTALEQL